MSLATNRPERAITNGVQVEVRSFFVPEQSDVRTNHYFFCYHIRIENQGDKPIQILSRHWVITDGQGRIDEVRGPGVIGQQPKLRPGEAFEYESFCPLTTPTGSMRGTYRCASENPGDPIAGSSEDFEVEIPQFFLVEPSCYH